MTDKYSVGVIRKDPHKKGEESLVRARTLAERYIAGHKKRRRER